jgi:DNA-binding protein YbaB
MDGNRKLKELFIDEEVYQELEKESLIDSLIEGFNNAIKDADHVNENEMKSTAFNILPGMDK